MLEMHVMLEILAYCQTFGCLRVPIFLAVSYCGLPMIPGSLVVLSRHRVRRLGSWVVLAYPVPVIVYCVLWLLESQSTKLLLRSCSCVIEGNNKTMQRFDVEGTKTVQVTPLRRTVASSA